MKNEYHLLPESEIIRAAQDGVNVGRFAEVAEAAPRLLDLDVPAARLYMFCP